MEDGIDDLFMDLEKIANEGITIEEVVGLLDGENLQEIRSRQNLREEIQLEANTYRNTSPSSWPIAAINWDVSLESQRFSFDGCSYLDFKKNHPDGFLLGWVKLAEMDRKLTEYCHRTDWQLWEVGDPGKLAFVIAHAARRLPISPPLIAPFGCDQVYFVGGNHRYAMARALKLEKIPVYLDRNHLDAIERRLSISL